MDTLSLDLATTTQATIPATILATILPTLAIIPTTMATTTVDIMVDSTSHPSTLEDIHLSSETRINQLCTIIYDIFDNKGYSTGTTLY